MSFSTDRDKQKETMNALLSKKSSPQSTPSRSETNTTEVQINEEVEEPTKPLNIIPKKIKREKPEKKAGRVFALTDSEHKKFLKKAKEYGYVHVNGQPNGSQFLSAIIKDL
ncbi:hypothetical protein FP435_00025 (plasmid) [Lactobacillus sp. PV037]|uniref:hypothetical protein n=1 Tax=Lactobacillus sp. PV037 TaxID=2594496 RepID=UPI00223FB1EC|nr:hypothetical protein [Lactobacillus sp. PV037]QNQ82927.1 hypothetical protein FP435_00025 [Lactobacillus sp. PV037]